MWINKITISNYRSFFKRTEIPLEPGTNLLLGENNSGKSTILNALSPTSVEYEPHLSVETKPSPSSIVQSEQRISIDACVRTGDVWKCLGDGALLPIPSTNGSTTFDAPGYVQATKSIEFSFEIVRLNGSLIVNFFHLIEGKKYGGSPSSGQGILCCRMPHIAANQPNVGLFNYSQPDVFNRQWEIFKTRMYRFRAERLSPHTALFGASTTLKPDASNLAECLNSMQSQLPHLFEEYIEHVNHIFPSVHRIQAVALEGQNAFAIRAWLAPASARRFDLSIPLLQMGTGVGQVLAILYVAMSSLEPITIGIDEPNSFLHPKAVRSLLQILNALPIKHQYIITTHSPEVIRAAEQNGIVVVINENGISRTQRLDPSNIDDIKESLASIGARLSDVYGADKILWVEGETEEIAFPKIAQRLRGIDTVGVSILKVNATGDFERKKPGRARMIFNTYKKLSSSNSLIPPAIGFIFDREGRSEREIEHLIRESGGSVMFTDRRCYENYLLRPNAIAKVLSNSLQDNVDVERVRAWILENGNSNAYINGSSEIIEGQYLWDSLDWLKRVDAPKLLADLFSSLSENTVEYRKIKHSIEITDVIMIDEFEQLDPIAELIKQRLLQYDAAST